MTEIKSEAGDRFYMEKKIEDMLNGGWELLHIQLSANNRASSDGYETTAYFKRSVSNN